MKSGADRDDGRIVSTQRNTAKRSRYNVGTRVLVVLSIVAMLSTMAAGVASARDNNGLGAGPDSSSEVLKMNLARGLGEFLDSDGAGGFMRIKLHTNWRRDWDDVALGNLIGTKSADAVFSDAATGLVAVAATDGEGNLKQHSVATKSLFKGKTQLVAGDFTQDANDEVLAADLSNGRATLQEYGANGFSEAKSYNNWWKGWDEVSAGNFSSSRFTELFLVDYDSGAISVQVPNGRGDWKQKFFSRALSDNFDDHAVGDFSDDGYDDVFFYGRDGSGELWLGSRTGKLTKRRTYSNLGQWEEISAGDFVSPSDDDLIFAGRDGNRTVTNIYEVRERSTRLSLRHTIIDWWKPGEELRVSRRHKLTKVAYPDPQTFTKQAFGIGRNQVPATIPLMLVKTESKAETNKFELSDRQLSNLAFRRSSRDGGNISSYFSKNADGSFAFLPAEGDGVMGPIVFDPADNKWGIDVGIAIRRNVVQEMANRGFDFASFDKNRDGEIRDDELIIQFVESTGAGGASRGLTSSGPEPCWRPDGVTVDLCLQVGSSTQRAFVTMTHEIAHAFGMIDLYTPNCRNQDSTLMSCTGDGRNSPIMHLDPWHKLDLGWEDADAYRLNQQGACVWLRKQSDRRSDVVILWDPLRGHDEYFILEYREIDESGYEDILTWNASGLIAWRVKTDPSGNPNYSPYEIRPGKDGALNTVPDSRDVMRNGRIFAGPDQILDSRKNFFDDFAYGPDVSAILHGNSDGSQTAFRAVDGVFTLEWSDHTPLPMEFKVTGDGTGLLRVAWYSDLDDAPRFGPQAGCFNRVKRAG